MSLPRDKCNVPMDAFARGKYELESLLAKVLLEEDAELEKAFVEFNTGSLEGIPKSLVKILTKGKDGDYIQLPLSKDGTIDFDILRKAGFTGKIYIGKDKDASVISFEKGKIVDGVVKPASRSLIKRDDLAELVYALVKKYPEKYQGKERQLLKSFNVGDDVIDLVIQKVRVLEKIETKARDIEEKTGVKAGVNNTDIPQGKADNVVLNVETVGSATGKNAGAPSIIETAVKNDIANAAKGDVGTGLGTTVATGVGTDTARSNATAPGVQNELPQSNLGDNQSRVQPKGNEGDKAIQNTKIVTNPDMYIREKNESQAPSNQTPNTTILNNMDGARRNAPDIVSSQSVADKATEKAAEKRLQGDVVNDPEKLLPGLDASLRPRGTDVAGSNPQLKNTDSDLKPTEQTPAHREANKIIDTLKESTTLKTPAQTPAETVPAREPAKDKNVNIESVRGAEKTQTPAKSTPKTNEPAEKKVDGVGVKDDKIGSQKKQEELPQKLKRTNKSRDM
jgi:hypothetical protein